jgi:hypothetical protein
MMTPNAVFPDFQSLPLCCNKRLWEAYSQTTWDEEYTFALGDLKDYHMRCVGDLFDMQHMATNEKSRFVNALCNWNAGIDGLGMLLTIATSLV